MSELDGTYQVSSTTNYDGPLKKKSDGLTKIINGETSRIDETGVMWHSRFEITGETEVEMTSVADPSEADPDFALTKPNGTPTREAVTYKTTLKMARKDDRIQLSGQIEYGDEIVFLTMRRLPKD